MNSSHLKKLDYLGKGPLSTGWLLANIPRVARWYVFKPKIPNWVNIAIEDDGIFYVIWSILWPFLYIL
jgi:hypothetical protein